MYKTQEIKRDVDLTKRSFSIGLDDVNDDD